jgi:hypothetical protein
MKNKIIINDDFTLFQSLYASLLNDIDSAVKEKITKNEFFSLIQENETKLCVYYNANFKIKYEQNEGIIFLTICLNDVPLVTFSVIY